MIKSLHANPFWTLFLCCFWVLPLFPQVQTTPPAPYGPLPSKAQLKWHELEMYGLIHFTPTTYQNKEWGFGDASPEIFNPNQFDPDQLMKAAQAAGLKGMILVAKHHDGFCLWPTATTSYNITQSPWKAGKGDMVADYEKSARQHQLQFGIYVSAWDRNHPDYGQPAYAEAYRQQLKELYTGYGPLFISWHDGANGGDGYYNGQPGKRTIDRSHYYEWEEKTWKITRELQPEAVIFSDIGPDVRWVGNERGRAPYTSWSTLTPVGPDGQKPAPGHVDETYLGFGQRDGKFWIPAECDVPLRPGWFYHPEQDQNVKTPQQLFDLYLQSVGRGAALNIGLAPTPEGILHQNDVEALTGFGKKIRETFSKNLAADARIVPSNIRGNDSIFDITHLTQNDPTHYWATDDEVTEATLEIMLPSPKSFDLIQLEEVLPLGQRIEWVEIYHLEDGKWQFIAQAESIGAKRIFRLPKTLQSDQLKIKLKAPVAIALKNIGLFKEFQREEYNAQKNVNSLDPSAFEMVIADIPIAKEQNSTNHTQLLWEADQQTKYPLDIHFTFKQATIPNTLVYVPAETPQTSHIKNYKVLWEDEDGQWHEGPTNELGNVVNNPIEQWIPLSLEKPIKALKLRVLNTQHKTNDTLPLALKNFHFYLSK